MTDIEDLQDAIEWSCQPQNIHNILKGRERVLAMPRDWVLSNFEYVALRAVALNDYWEYLRLLELSESLSADLVCKFVLIGLDSDDPDIKEVAVDFRAL